MAAAGTGINSGSSQDSSCITGRDQMIAVVPSGLKRFSKKRWGQTSWKPELVQ